MPNVSTQAARRLQRLLGLLQATSPKLAARVALQLFLSPSRRRMDRVDARELEHAQRHELLAAGRRFRVYQWGNGPQACVMLHGWGSHAARFATLSRPLRAQGWRVLAIDAPGHGASPGRTSSLPEFRAALDATIADLGPVKLLVGHSLGALAVTTRLAERLPNDTVQAAVLVGMPQSAGFLLERYRQMLDIHEPTASLLRDRFIARFGRPPEDFDALAMAPRIRVPVLLLHDHDDDIVPIAHARAMHQATPGSLLLPSRDLGHSGILRNRESIAAITAFTKDFHDG